MFLRRFSALFHDADKVHTATHTHYVIFVHTGFQHRSQSAAESGTNTELMQNKGWTKTEVNWVAPSTLTYTSWNDSAVPKMTQYGHKQDSD